jgi:hypothetical protein
MIVKIRDIGLSNILEDMDASLPVSARFSKDGGRGRKS